MWRAYPLGWLARSYRVDEGDRAIGTLVFGSWSERGALELDGRRLPIRREGSWNPRFVLADGSTTLAAGRRAGVFRRGFVLAAGDEEYGLVPISFLGYRYALLHRGRSCGEIRAVGMLKRTLEAELDEALAPELRLFAVWLVVLAFHRAASTAVVAS